MFENFTVKVFTSILFGIAMAVFINAQPVKDTIRKALIVYVAHLNSYADNTIKVADSRVQ